MSILKRVVYCPSFGTQRYNFLIINALHTSGDKTFCLRLLFFPELLTL